MTKVIRSFLILSVLLSPVLLSCTSSSSVTRTTTMDAGSSGRTTTLGSNSNVSRTTTLGNSSSSKKSKPKKTKKKNDPSQSSSTVADTHVHPDALKAVRAAKTYTGTKYKYGGMDKKGMDCSGLMYLSYKSAGVHLPRTSVAQSNTGKRVYVGELLPGDLIFFGAKPNSKKITHVGIVTYSKDGEVKFMHASSSRGVVEDALTPAYWTPRYIKATRPTAK